MRKCGGGVATCSILAILLVSGLAGRAAGAGETSATSFGPGPAAAERDWPPHDRPPPGSDLIPGLHFDRVVGPDAFTSPPILNDTDRILSEWYEFTPQPPPTREGDTIYQAVGEPAGRTSARALSLDSATVAPPADTTPPPNTRRRWAKRRRMVVRP